jgi:hypothetical protein
LLSSLGRVARVDRLGERMSIQTGVAYFEGRAPPHTRRDLDDMATASDGCGRSGDTRATDGPA